MSAFGRYHPLVTFLYFLLVVGIAMFVVNPIIQAIALCSGIFFLLALGKKSGYAFYIIIFLLIASTNPLFSHNGVTILFFINGNAVTAESVYCGLGIGATVVGVIVWFGCFNKVFTNDKILYLFSKITPKIALILSTGLRFIPLFIRKSKQVLNAQKALGINDDSLINKTKNRIKIYSAVTAWAFENAIETSLAMKSRAYGNGKRSCFFLYKFTLRDTVMLIVISTMFFVCICGMVLGAVDFDYYPNLSKINTSIFAITTYISYGILALLPLILEAEEALIWKFCVHKI